MPAIRGAEPGIELGAFSIRPAIKDIEAPRKFCAKFGFGVFGGDATQNWLSMKDGTHVMKITSILLTIAGVGLAVSLAVRRSFYRVRAGANNDFIQDAVENPPKRWIIGGMMGSGKTTFARSLSQALSIQHVEVDRCQSESEVLEAIKMAEATGWVAEANPWQIPQVLAQWADVIVFLDYDNSVNCWRLLKRGLWEWSDQGYSWRGFRRSIIDRAILDLGRIVYLHGKNNRDGWKRDGLLRGMETGSARLVRCISPAELKRIEESLRSPKIASVKVVELGHNRCARQVSGRNTGVHPHIDAKDLISP